MNEGFTTSMFWAGAMMAVTPLLFAGIVIGTWWFQRKKRELARQQSERPSAD